MTIFIANLAVEQQADTMLSASKISLVEASISKDEITLGGIEKTKESLIHTTQQTTHQGTEILSDQIFIHAENQLDVIAASLLNATTAGQVILSGDKINVTGIQNTTAETKTQETETTTLTVGVRNAYVDAALAVQALYEATKALDKANDAYRDAKRRVEKGELSESALKDYEINRATAAAQLAMAQIAAASAAYGAATAASSSMGTGFYASVGAQHTESSSSATVTQGEWQGSQIQAGNLNTQNTQFTAGVEDYSSQTHSSSKTASARVGTNGAAAVSLGNSQAQSQNSSTAYVNSQIQVGHLQSNSENLTLQGANLQTQTANLNVVNLTVESLQNTASSSNTSRSNNLGISVGSGGSVGVSLGHSQSQGNSQAQQVNQQTQLLIADGENSQITVQNTRLIGGLIANATQDEKGNLTDHGQLNLSTQTLSVSHLDNKTSSEQRGFGIQVSVSTQKNDSGTREVSGGSSTLSLQHQGHLTEGLTQATLGLGNIQVGGQTLSNHPDDNNRLEGLNRDLSQREITTKNQQTAGLNAGITIDHRLLTEKGREEILQEQKGFVDNSKKALGGATGDLARIGAVVGSALDLSLNQTTNAWKTVGKGQELAYTNDGKLAGNVEDMRDGNILDGQTLQEGLQQTANFFNPEDGQHVRITEGATNTEGKAVYGAAHENSNTMFVDIEGNRLNSLVNTVAHEGMHLKGAGETNATATGYLTDFTYRVNAWANSGQISEHRATAPVGILNPAAHQQLLGGNNDLFNSLDSRDELEFRFLPQSERDLANQLAAQSGGQLTPEAIMNTMRNSKTMEVEPNGFYGAVVDITQASPEALAALDPSNGSIFVTTDAEGNAKYLIQNMSEIPVNASAKALLEEQGYSFYEKALGDYNILPPRDPASGRVLDETGRYSVPMIVGDEVFHVPNSPCASGQVCNGANRDQSNSAVQAWDRALAAEKFDDLSNVATGLTILHPVGQGAKIISGVATASSVTSAAYDGALAQTLLNEGSSRAFERVLVDVFWGRFGAGANNAFSLFGLNEIAKDLPKDNELIDLIKGNEK